MTVIIRLQNLPWTANALDVRRFFQGLIIPDGGVHIVGGEKGDAFIAFATDEDARQAMYLDNGRICDTQVKLFLSSKTEMQNVIAIARGASTPQAPPAQTSSGSDFNRPTKSSGGYQMGQQGGTSGMHERNASNFQGSRNQQHGGMGADRTGNVGQGSRDNRPSDMASTNDRYYEQGESNNRSGGNPERMGTGYNRAEGPPSNMEGPGRMGGSGHHRMSGNQVNQSRMNMGSDGMSSTGNRMDSDRMSGGYDRGREDSRMGSNDRMRGGQGRMGGSASVDGEGAWRRDGPSRMDGDRNDSGQLGGRQNRMEQYDRQDRQGSAEGRTRGRGGPVHGGNRRSFVPILGDDRNRRHSNQDRSDRGRVANLMDVDNMQSYDSFENQSRPSAGRFRDSNPRDDLRGDSDYGREDRYQETNMGGYDNDNRRSRDNERNDDREWNRQESWNASYDAHPEDRYDDENFRQDGDDRYRGRDQGNFHDQNNFVDQRDCSFDQDELAEDMRHGPYDQRSVHDEMDFMPDQMEPFQEMEQDYYDGDEYEINDNRRMGFGHDSGFPRGGRGRGRGGFRGRGRGRGFGPDNLSERPARFDTVRQDRDDLYIYVCNMPFSVSYKDVRRFFTGCEIPSDGLKLINDKNGKRDGTAYVMFGKPGDCFNALKRDGQMMENRRVRVDKCSLSDYDQAIDSFRPGQAGGFHGSAPPAKRFRSRSPIIRSSHDGSNCIVMTNVHFRATRLDVRNFLGSVKIHSSGGPHIELGKDGRPTGTVYVELESKGHFKAALNQNEKYLMRRCVEIHPVTKKEFEKHTISEEDKKEDTGDTRQVVQKGAADNTEKSEEGANGNQDDKKFFCVKMRGLPFSSTVNDVREFFTGLGIANRGLSLITSRQGQATGLAYVEFVTSMDCKKALDKDKEYMGKRYIDIMPITKKDMLEEIKVEQQKANSGINVPSRPPLKGIPELPGISRPGCTITMSNLPFKVQLEDIMAFLEFCNPIQDSVRLRYSKDGTPTGDAMVAFRSPSDAQRAIREFNRKQMLGRQVVLAMAP